MLNGLPGYVLRRPSGSWGPTPTETWEQTVDYQAAAPTERDTHLAPSKYRSQRVRIEGWRQKRLG